MEPVLPPELEREIFETAAYIDRSDIPALLLVCKRVHQWIEPLLYRSITIVARDDSRLLAVQARPAAFLQRNLHHLCVAYNSTDTLTGALKTLLSYCPNLRSLYFDGNLHADFLPILDNMRPQRLCLWVDKAFAPASWAGSMLTRPMLLCVTHLELYYDQNSELDTALWDWNEWSYLASLPALTHLCFSEALSAQLLRPTLDNCRTLCVLITLFSNFPTARAFEPTLTALAGDDPRVVVVVVGQLYEDLESGFWGEMDFWARADEFVTRKRSGQTQNVPLNYYLDQ
ncbi:hypothetical protein R3P38DRAFT_2599662 [Favolaschia claudopus]|uniref:F-box domain-containing protein n=1 Tax=Favolaschia claudopus TaxID=2862362 RepID=A0AAW0E2Z5_9AGAR